MCRTSEAWIRICFLARAAGPAPGLWSSYGRNGKLLCLSCPPCMGTADPCHPCLPRSLSPKASAYSHRWGEAAEQDRRTAGPTHTPEPWAPWLGKAKPQGGCSISGSITASTAATSATITQHHGGASEGCSASASDSRHQGQQPEPAQHPAKSPACSLTKR